MMNLENGHYLVRFGSQEEALTLLTGGPWVVMGHYLLV